jgi:nucleoside-diphosphate-sugar epimerase
VSVVVTGAAGFIGRTLVSTLVARGEHVVAVDREPDRPRQGVTVITADLLAGDERAGAALSAADAVFHLAGCPGVRDSRRDIAAHRLRDNVLATARVLELVPRRTPLLVTSSSSVYGGSAGRPSAETDPLRPRAGYAMSKARAERLCAERAAAGSEIVVVRPFTVAGEGQRPDMALAQWIAAAMSGRPLCVLGSLDRTRDVTDVREVARALVALVDRSARGVVNVGTGMPHRLADLVDAVAIAVGRDVRTYVQPAGPAEVTDTLADTRRLRRLAGFVPETELPALVARQAAAAGLARRLRFEVAS